MANKAVTITEPVANNVRDIRIVCDGQGNISRLNGQVDVPSSDGSTAHSNNFDFDVTSLPAAVQTAVTSLVNESLTRFKSQHGF